MPCTVECGSPSGWAAAFSGARRHDGRNAPDLPVGGTFGRVTGPASRALRNQSKGSGGSASRTW